MSINRTGPASACTVLGALAVLLQACIAVDFAGKRKFATEAAAVAQLRAHEAEYRAVASGWRQSGQEEFCNFGPHDYWWNQYRVSRSDSGWDVTHWDGTDYVKEHASAFEATAPLAGTSASVIHHWMEMTTRLSVECVARKEISFRSRKSDFVEIGFVPPLSYYGFWYAPESHSASHPALALWAARAPARPGHQLVKLWGPWFYFEGYLGSLLPLSKVRGLALDAKGAPAVGVKIEIAKVDDRGRLDLQRIATAEVEADGSFHFLDLTAGNYVLGINLQSVPALEAPYPQTYYPGVAHREQATLLRVPETSSIEVQKFPVPQRLAERKIIVRVIGRDGKPAEDARVCQQASDDGSCYPVEAVDGGLGVYGFTGLEGVEYRISAAVSHGFELPFIVFRGPSFHAPQVRIPAYGSPAVVEMRLTCDGTGYNLAGC